MSDAFKEYENGKTALDQGVVSSSLLCGWMPEEEDSNWFQTDCGEIFILEDAPPIDKSIKFCCYCGKPLIEQTLED